MFESIDTVENDLIRFADGGFVLPLPFRLVSSGVGKVLIQLAGGKVPESLSQLAADHGGPRPELQKSASRFVAEVMLSPVSNHFTTLGVSPDFDANELRDNFRRLMALVHPDAHPVGFPDDAASRVNRAYAVLADANTRETYAALELGAAALGAMAPSLRATRSIEPRSSGRTPSARSSRLLGFANALRARQSLLWIAALLLVPLGMGFMSLFERTDPQRLVEARPRLSAAVDVSSLAAKSDSATSANGTNPVSVLPERSGITDMRPLRTERTATKAQLVESTPVQIEASQPMTQPRPIMTAQLSTKSLEVSERPTVSSPPNLAPIPASTGFESQLRVTAPVESAAPVRAPELQTPPAQQFSASPSPSSSASTAAVTSTQRGVLATEKGETSQKLRSTDAEEVVVRFSNAYESGTIGAFGQLLSPNMLGRRQMLSDYERVFQSTRQRSIKFKQLKHAANGDRISTSGYATVTTTDQDNKVITQRVFLEFDIGRERGESRIERLANYVIN